MTERRQTTTAPPPFDPEQYARNSEANVRVALDHRTTDELAVPPPLNKRVRLAAPAEDLEWFDLSEGARALLARVDGTKTLLELMEGLAADDVLKAIAELHDAKLLAFEP